MQCQKENDLAISDMRQIALFRVSQGHMTATFMHVQEEDVKSSTQTNLTKQALQALSLRN